ncbi:MAG: methionyl-tRNA formyltransferase [Eubacterium sp.]|nr:methionyl-tRNA formyltransferase [Eubacterium sp.]
MRVVFMGTPDFASYILKKMAEAGIDVIAAVTQTDKPFGRKAILKPSPVKEAALELGIPVLQPARVRDEAFLDELKALAPDAIVVAAYGKIIPKTILELPKYGCLNVHASLLPKYRGAAPIQWALLDGESETGVTIMRMDEGLDTGDMLEVRKVIPAPDETGGSLFDKLAEAGACLLMETLQKVEAGTACRTRQPAESPTRYARMITKEDGRIDWSKDSAGIERQVRALYPWPGTFTSLFGKNCKIWQVSLSEVPCEDPGSDRSSDESSGFDPALSVKSTENTLNFENNGKETDTFAADNGKIKRAMCKNAPNREAVSKPENGGNPTAEEGSKEILPGTVLFAGREGILVQTGDGVLLIRELQLEGRKRMTADAFLRGCPLEPGNRFI